MRDTVAVAVVGDGPGGAATALALRRGSGLSVALVGGGGGSRRKIGETIQPECRGPLEQLGVWQSFLAASHAPSHGTCSAWGGPDLTFRDFMFHGQGSGWHLDRRRFDDDLLAAAIASGVEVARPAALLSAARSGQGWTLRLRQRGEEPRLLSARFVVDASGRAAAFATLQGARRVVFDDLVGVYGFFAFDGETPPRDSFTLVEATENGWWYSAVLPGGQLVAAYMTDRARIRSEHLRDPRRWLDLARACPRIAARLEGATALTDPAVAPAGSHLLRPIAGPGWLAVGDAASCYDPLSSRGIVKALIGGLGAADAIRDELDGNAGAVDAWQARLAAEFEYYLETRQNYYRMETRWPGSAFWARRQGFITLPPSQMLLCAAEDRISGLRMHMVPGDLLELARLCRSPRPAHAVVAEFRSRSARTYTDRRIVLALQYLLEEGIIVPDRVSVS